RGVRRSGVLSAAVSRSRTHPRADGGRRPILLPDETACGTPGRRPDRALRRSLRAQSCAGQTSGTVGDAGQGLRDPGAIPGVVVAGPEVREPASAAGIAPE